MAGNSRGAAVVDLTECDESDDSLEPVAATVVSSSANQPRTNANAPGAAELDQALRTHVEQLRSISSGANPRGSLPVRIDLRETPLDSESDFSSDDEPENAGLVPKFTSEPVVPPKAVPLAGAKCPICLSVPERMCATPCGHLYCGDCVFDALSNGPGATKRAGTCSICRTPVLYSSVLFLEAWPVPRSASSDNS